MPRTARPYTPASPSSAAAKSSCVRPSPGSDPYRVERAHAAATVKANVHLVGELACPVGQDDADGSADGYASAQILRGGSCSLADGDEHPYRRASHQAGTAPARDERDGACLIMTAA